jgi:putative ABC transport system permease protein
MMALWQDIRYAVRMLRKSPGFTAVIVLTLTLGIGANTAIFSVINTTFLCVLPYPEPDRLVYLSEQGAEGNAYPVSYPNFLDWQKQQDVFSGLAVFHNAEGRLKTERGTELAAVQHVSAEFFSTLGVQPVQGRRMRPDDDLPGAERVAWVTNDAWQRFFNGDSDLVGRSFDFDGQSLAIAGILPADFRFQRQADLITAIAPFAKEFILDMRANHNNEFAVARLKPGVSLDAAQAQMDTISQRLAQEYPEADTGIGIAVVPLREELAGRARTQLLLLLGAAGLVLLVACVNVANMLLARSFSREREMAIRISVGASRWHLLRQLLIESVVLAALGGVSGVCVGLVSSEALGRLVPFQIQRLIDGSGFDPWMLLFTVGITLVTGVVFGLAPAWRLSHVRPGASIKQTPRRMRTTFGCIGLSDLLVVGQVTLALLLLIGAGLMIRSLHRLLDVDTGYEPTRVLTLEVVSPAVERFHRDPGVFTRHYERVLEPVQNMPGVEAAAVASGMPFTFSMNSMSFYLGDRPTPAAGEFPVASQHTISPDYFRAMGIPLLRGHVFDGTEPAYVVPDGMEITPQSLPMIFENVTLSGIVSQRMADRCWPGQDPIGKRFRLGLPDLGLPWVEVIGVVGNTVQTGLDHGEAAEFYLSLDQWPVPVNMHLLVRTRLDPAAFVNSVRTAVESAVHDGPIRDVRVLAERIESSTAGRRFNRDLFVCFAATALALASIGLYGVLAFNVGRRTREIGIRMALGANRRDVVRSVVMRGFTLVLPGLAIGLGCAWAMGRVLRSQLFEITGSDPFTYVICALLMLLTAAAACLLPARRAARIDPMVALRCE